MNAKEAWIAGALLEGSRRGLNVSETIGLLKQAVFGLETTGNVLGSLVKPALGLGLAAGVGIPVAAGALGGYGLAKFTDDDSAVDAAKAQELMAEYQRLRDQALRNSATRDNHHEHIALSQ